MKNLLLPILTLLLLFPSCADFKMHVEGEAIQQPPASFSEPEHTMFLIGDAGDVSSDESASALVFLEQKLEEAPKNSSVVFLGDLVYPNGLPSRKSKGRQPAEQRINEQLDILQNFKGEVFFVPGNNDWNRGRKGVERLEDYIQDTLDRGNVFQPSDGCSGPEVVDLNKDLVLLLVDSEWFLMNWDKERELNEGCDIKSREAFAFFIQDEMKKNRQKNIVVAMHHPLHSNGPSGGRFSAKQHIFPLTDLHKSLWVPLPILGTVYRFFQTAAGTRQSLSHPQARELKTIMESSAKKNGSFIFVSGHEHNLQYFEKGNQSFVVSGAGSNPKDPAGKGRGAQFTYGGVYGFSVLKFYKDGEVVLEMWQAENGGKEGKLLFSRQIKGKLSAKKADIPTEFPEYEAKKDSSALALKTEVKNGPVHRFFWGDHYRAAYMQPVKAPVLDLATWRGGVEPQKRGGGSQTNSLRVLDPKGKSWVLRSMTKDESRILPYPYNKTFAKDVFADQFTSANPYVAFVIPALADAAGVYHTNPKLYYMPKQPRLGEFNDIFGGGFYLVEERADGDWSDVASLGNSKDLIGTPDVIDNLEKNHKHRIDGAFTVRSRLFDNLIGDWDRHDDNWRWASFKDKEEGITTYRPIPRDRDQPFCKYDGAIPALVRLGVPFLKQLRVYTSEVPNIKWQNYHSKYFDPTFLSEPDWAVWEREAKHIMENLTDETIDKALHNFPPEIHALDASWIAPRLKGRRDNLLKIARDFYLLVSKEVDVVGTNEQDYFEVDRLDDKRTRVRMYASNKTGDKKRMLYERTFLKGETKEVRLYGLDQEDRFIIRGKVNDGITIRAIGGLDDDYFIDSSQVSGLGKKTKFYDTKDENHLTTGSEARDKTSNDPVLNTYDRRSWDQEHNFGIGYPILAGNPDDGIVIGGGALLTTYGFKKSPYAAKHSIGGKFAIETKGYELHYSGEYIHALHKWDLLLDAQIQGPLYTRNFFGFGNETPDLLEGDEFSENFIRVRQQLFGLYPALRRQLKNNLSFSFGAGAEAIKIEDLPERLVNSNNPLINDDVFENIYFGGGVVQLNYLNSDNLVNPHLGITMNATLGWKANLENTKRNFWHMGGYFGVYIGGERIVLASKVGFEHVTGEWEFYQGATLGARENIRGYRNERFTGETAFYQQNDLRIHLFNVENYVLPFTLGVLGGYDQGRVWLEGEHSDKWHDAYGGGIWLSPFDLAVLTFSYFQSDDGPRFQFKGGFAF